MSCDSLKEIIQRHVMNLWRRKVARRKTQGEVLFLSSGLLVEDQLCVKASCHCGKSIRPCGCAKVGRHRSKRPKPQTCLSTDWMFRGQVKTCELSASVKLFRVSFFWPFEVGCVFPSCMLTSNEFARSTFWGNSSFSVLPCEHHGVARAAGSHLCNANMSLPEIRRNSP